MELDRDMRFILGRPCFLFINIAETLRNNGWEIKRKAEDEQACGIFWMLSLREKYGDKWRDFIDKELDKPTIEPPDSIKEDEG